MRCSKSSKEFPAEKLEIGIIKKALEDFHSFLRGFFVFKKPTPHINTPAQ
jgi:hypothetical protein